MRRRDDAGRGRLAIDLDHRSGRVRRIDARPGTDARPHACADVIDAACGNARRASLRRSVMPFLPPDQMRTLGAVSTVGLAFVLAIVIGTAFGWWVDDKLGTAPFGFFIFFFLGLAAAVLNVYRTMSRLK